MIGTPLLRFRSDEQLVALFRAGHDEAFRAIHERYHKRLLAYARQMLPRRQDAEDALQDVFVRAYSGLRASDRELALRAWLFRVAHNRCIDELRRPAPPAPEVLALLRPPSADPIAEVDLRESVRRLIEDIRRLPDQQRSALLMRELGGMSYTDLACTLEISVPAVKSLLVRARLALARAAEARDTACSEIREELIVAHDRGVRPNAMARRHMRDCSGCRRFRRELRGVSHQLAALAPVGPLGLLAQLLGFSGGGATFGGASAGGGLAAAGGGGTVASAGGLVLGANHVATLLVAAVATAGGAVEIQHTITAASHHAHARPALSHRHRSASTAGSSVTGSGGSSNRATASVTSASGVATATPPTKAPAVPEAAASGTAAKHKLHGSSKSHTGGGANVGPAVPDDSTTSTAGTDAGTTAGSTTCVAVTSSTAAPSSTSTTSTTTSSTTAPAVTCSSTGTGSSTPATSTGSQATSGGSTGTGSSATSTGTSDSTATGGGSTTSSSGGTATATASTTEPAASGISS
jgi:RNA polymerase sigma factor (sigma-70 family)